MNRDEIVALAQKCGGTYHDGVGDHLCLSETALQSFAAAIAEECAKALGADFRLISTPTAARIVRAAFPAPETKP